MNPPATKCPNPECGSPVSPRDAFCAQCGRALPGIAEEVASPLVEKEPPPTPISSPVPGLLDVLAARTSAPLPTHTPDPAPRASAMADMAAAGFPPPSEVPSASDCPDLDVRYNNSCVFVLNMQSTFDFNIVSKVDGIRDLSIEVRQSGYVIAREKPSVISRRGMPLTLGLNYTPRNTHPGKVSFEIRISYRKDQQRRTYAAYRTHTVYSGKEDPRQVCESLVVEIKNNIQQGHAGDIRVDQDFNQLREALKQRNSIEVDREFLQIINNRPFWAVLPLFECAEESSPSVAPAAGPRPLRLMLRGQDGSMIHIIASSAAKIGRSRQCEILARVTDANGAELREESLRISQVHATLEWSGRGCAIRDGGQHAEGWRSSTCGSWVDAARIPAGGKHVLEPGSECRLTLASAPGGASAQVSYTARVWRAGDLPQLRPGCPDFRSVTGSAACMTLKRLNSAQETAVFLKHAASLSWVDGRCGDACVCLRDGALHASDGHGCNPLAPGRNFRAGSMDFQVLEPGSASAPGAA